VRSPDEDDWGKVKKVVLSYLKGTLHIMTLILSADLLTLSLWWVDAAYVVHDDCWGHTGVGMSFGQGMALNYSWKQKTTQRAYQKLNWLEWTTHWGISSRLVTLCRIRDITWIHHCSLYQDNMSAILLETNRRVSSSKQNKHIKVLYFLIKDKVN